jgi:hypothetical protein
MNLPSDKLSKKEQSDDAGQFVGKRVGRARAGMREERSDDRSPATAPCRVHRGRAALQRRATRTEMNWGFKPRGSS